MKQIRVIYYSATGNTLRVLQRLVEDLRRRWALPICWSPYTTPEERAHFGAIEPDELVVWGSPVYAGRLPNKLRPFIEEHLHGYSNPTLLVATFGNRSYDNTLAEMQALSTAQHLRVIGAVAMAMPHAFDNAIGEDRPTDEDWKALDCFAQNVDPMTPAIGPLPGNPDAPYYRPLRDDLAPAQFLKAVPEIDSMLCTGCGECLSECPMGSIRRSEKGVVIEGICIKCGACIKGCPAQALSINDPDYLAHVRMLKTHCQQPAENGYFQ